MSGDEILQAAADIYRQRGPMQRGVPVSTFLTLVDQGTLEQRLADLLDVGALVPFGRGTVALAPSLRLALVNRPVLTQWMQNIELVEGDLRVLVMAGIREELRLLARWGYENAVSNDLVQRAAELAAVIAMHDLDLFAIDIAAGHPGTAKLRLAELLAVPEGSCRSMKELRSALSRSVSTVFVEQ